MRHRKKSYKKTVAMVMYGEEEMDFDASLLHPR